jgi:hypothetical protein
MAANIHQVCDGLDFRGLLPIQKLIRIVDDEYKI